MKLHKQQQVAASDVVCSVSSGRKGPAALGDGSGSRAMASGSHGEVVRRVHLNLPT